MTNSFKATLALVLALVIGVAIYGAYQYPKAVSVGSPAGSTFSSAKVAQINMTPSSASATSSSILNPDSSDRIVLDGFVSCTPAGATFAQTAAGVAAWIWTVATTSTAAPAVLPSAAVTLAAMNVSVSTSTTADSFAATSTYTITNSRRWNAGSYLTFQANATSSTAACTVGVHYIGS